MNQIYELMIPSVTCPKIHLSQVKELSNKTCVDVKGKIFIYYENETNTVIKLTDRKNNVVKATLFGNAIERFKDKNFHIGDTVKFKNARINIYKERHELLVNEYSKILKLKPNLSQLSTLYGINS